MVSGYCRSDLSQLLTSLGVRCSENFRQKVFAPWSVVMLFSWESAQRNSCQFSGATALLSNWISYSNLWQPSQRIAEGEQMQGFLGGECVIATPSESVWFEIWRCSKEHEFFRFLVILNLSIALDLSLLFHVWEGVTLVILLHMLK